MQIDENKLAESSSSDIEPTVKNNEGGTGPKICVSLASTEWAIPYESRLINDEIINWIADQGIDCIRIPLNEKSWLTQYDDYALPIDRLISNSNKLGMEVILDLHWSVQNDLLKTPNNNVCRVFIH